MYPAKAQFASGERIGLCAELRHVGTGARKLRMEARVMLLDRHVGTLFREVELPAEGTAVVEWEFAAIEADCDGYGVDVTLYDGEEALETYSTAFDVVSDWRKATRYGFLSDFDTDESGVAADVDYLRKLHINLVQFYDWMYRHDDLVPPQSEFRDLMGRELSLDVVKEKIALCRRFGMKSIAYGAVYGASRDFYEQHPDWALYDSDGNVHHLIDLFFIMNIAPDSPWHDHILQQYERALTLVGFDGIHMDTYGAPKTAFSRLHGDERLEVLKEQFPVLIDHARERLERVSGDVGLIFNNVGNWPVGTVGDAKQDAMYIEVWPPYERYHHLRDIIARAKLLGNGKPVILAAYLKSYRDLPKDEWARANAAALLLTAAIAANGAYHLLHGEFQGILTQGYYVDYSRLDDAEFVRTIRNYYDFLVRYANVLYDAALEDVSMTHTGWDNVEYTFEGFPCSSYGEAGKMWTVIRESRRYKTISFINLSNNDDFWNEGKRTPHPQQGIQAVITLDGTVRSVFAASPDKEMGRPRAVPYRIAAGPKGKTLTVELPPVYVWELLVVEMEA
ncbi:hypothetical protein SD70_19905 [Gordoniibacillus kamchatkensis]|uniref:Cycloisomaltooligosaccharide glucanotransferase n=1 Tax=Gordoniibacillus kamchatkensis TaxID=1590651 RepID=A0ABR5AF72_9BACL|nr:hypothetical protein SD70_19905 [Paenibacillus sp. VKM B-2647]